jgi:hypothetical protein
METLASIPPNTYKLSPEEIQNPSLVFKSLFEFMNIGQLEQLLSEWLKMTVTGSYCSSEYKRTDREAIFLLYEQMQKLLQAVNLVQQDNKRNNALVAHE